MKIKQTHQLLVFVYAINLAAFVPASAQTRGLALMCVASGAPLLVCLLQPGLIVSAQKPAIT